MPAPIALQPGRHYHIYNRGNNRENLFVAERNYHYFLNLYAKYIEPIAETFAYCLLRNHFHLLIRINDELDKGMVPSKQFSNLFNAYARAFNKIYQRSGALFQRPFGRIEVTSDAYFVQLVTYIHLNPQKHGFVTDFRDWPYSSYHAIVSSKQSRVQRDIVLQWFQGVEQFIMFHQQANPAYDLVNLVSGELDCVINQTCQVAAYQLCGI